MRLRTVRRAAVGTSRLTSACATRSSGSVRSAMARLDQPDFLPGGREQVAGVHLPAAARLRFAVDSHLAVSDQRLRLAARVDDPGDLEQLAEPDHVAPDLHFAHALTVAG